MRSLCLVRRLPSLGRNTLLSCKSLTTTSNITVQREQLTSSGSNIASVVLHHSPVNSFNVSFTVELTQTLKEIEDSKEVEAIIIKSSLPNIFSAGLDLHELYGTPRDHMETFWRSVQELWFQIYSSKLVTMSLINGHCLAAGTIIAAACDYRIGIEGRYSLGVTAAKIGLVAPPWFLTMLCHLMGRRTTEHALQTSHTFSPDEAARVGLIDEVCSEEVAHDTCMQVLSRYLAVSQESRSTMKQYLRAELVREFEQSRDSDTHQFVDYVMKSSVQSKLGDYIQTLKRKA